ncbi:hypothetical protein [Methanosarcina sp. DH2]|jgi:hypothetical protein|nr:hypothetical protein [Methanosarcina sp. DH2]
METKECEVKCLLARMKNLKMKRGIIITSDNFALNPSTTQDYN